jgi:predicted RNA-binding protein YlqC (UPF0109 family)
MKEFLECVVKSLVDHPDVVALAKEEKGKETIFRVSAGQDDVDKIIGSRRRTASALRILSAAVAAKEGKRAILEIED